MCVWRWLPFIMCQKLFYFLLAWLDILILASIFFFVLTYRTLGGSNA
jgi:hypothetical protein